MHDEASEYVCHGEEQKQAGVGGVNDRSEYLSSCVGCADKVGVSQADTLRHAGCSRRVNDGCQITALDFDAACFNF